MNASFKLRGKLQYLAIPFILVLVGSLPASAKATQAPATSPATPAATAKATTPAPSGKVAEAPATTPTTTPATTAALPADATDTAAAPSEFTSWLTIGTGATFVSGDKGQFEHQHNTNSGVFGGVQDFHYQQFVGKSDTLEVDGHALVGNHDYALKFDLTDPNLGYIRAGYTDYRVWYDGTGGFYPRNGLSFQPSDNQLYVDQRSAWVEAGLTLPDLPIFTLRYEYDSREGQMDSTTWGQTTLTPGAAQTKIVPTYLGIDETRNIIKADVTDKIGDTDAGLGLRYEMDRTSDSTFINQSPTQAANAYITQNEIEKDQMFNAHGFTETLFSEKVTFSSGFSVTKIDTDLSGSRVYGPAYNTPVSRTFANNGTGYTGLGGGGNSKEYVGNLNLMWTPVPNLVVVPSLRIEYEDNDLSDTFSNTSGVGPAFVSTPTAAKNDNWYLDVAQSLEVRYTGFSDWSLYASGEWSEDKGNETWGQGAAISALVLNQDWNRLGEKYTFGANWYPLSQLNFGGQYYHEIHDYDYSSRLPPRPTTYPGYLLKQNFTVDDVSIRATWQALSTVAVVTRYDFQYSTVDTWGIPNVGTQAGGVESATMSNHILSEDATWTPLSCLYLQVGGSYVMNTLDTPVAGSAGINNLVLNSGNDYWTVDASVGYEIDAKTHLQLQYSYYNADNYVNNSTFSLPYGASAQENSFTATVTRQITKAVQVSVKYGFYRNRDDTSGGLNNYDAQLVYASTQIQF